MNEEKRLQRRQRLINNKAPTCKTVQAGAYVFESDHGYQHNKNCFDRDSLVT